jgi:uncharacterized protein YraI
MKSVTPLLSLVMALAAMPATSYAQQWAYTSQQVNLRAGPSIDYPVVAILPAGASILVEGCLSDYRWCDVVAGPNRGWLYAGNIVYAYQGMNVPVLTYGALIGIGIVGFNLGNYWDKHYRNRPWYPQRQHWIDRPRHASGRGGHYLPPPSPGFRPGPGQHPQQGPWQGGQRPPQGQWQHGGRPPPQGQWQGGQHPPQGQWQGGQHPPQGQWQGGQHPPQGQWQHGGQHPPQGPWQGGQHPPQGQWQHGGQHPPQGQSQNGGQRPPQGQWQHGGQRSPQDQWR